MRRQLLLCSLAFVPSSGFADPSQASFGPNLGLQGTSGSIEVVDAGIPTPTRADLSYWIAMDSVRSAPFVVRVERMTFLDGAECAQDDCVLDWRAGHEVDPGERLLIMASQAIASIEFRVQDGPQFVHFATIEGPFAECRRDAGARNGYADKHWLHSNPTIVIAPFPSIAEDLAFECVR